MAEFTKLTHFWGRNKIFLEEVELEHADPDLFRSEERENITDQREGELARPQNRNVRINTKRKMPHRRLVATEQNTTQHKTTQSNT